MMANIWWSLPLTLIVFFAARKLAARYKFPLLNPLLVAMVVIIPFLMLTGISYDSYFKGSEVLNDLLQPAVVALAYPLYEQLHQIRARWKSIITICFIGSVVAMVTGTSVALLMGASPEIAASILPKSVTTPIAMAVGGSIGGIPAISAVCVIFVGILGAVFGHTLLNAMRIRTKAARGLAMGTASHALGTARCAELEAAGVPGALARRLGEAISVGVLLVLLCPCVDYVIVFTGLADGDNRRLLSATPLLLLLQMALLPLYLTLFLGDDLREIVDVGPFLRAFVFLIVIPLALAWLTQAWSARTRAGQRVATGAGALMVPLMAVVLAVVVASQIPRIDGNLGALAPVIVVYAAFLVVMPLAGKAVAGLLRLDVPASRAVAFSGATRNSLVVLPLALALPTGYELAAAAVVAQTLVEMVGMVVYVRAIPRLVR